MKKLKSLYIYNIDMLERLSLKKKGRRKLYIFYSVNNLQFIVE